jgi:hypothetical protein
MGGFLLDCCFNSGYEGLKFRESTARYAKSTLRYEVDAFMLRIQTIFDWIWI